MIAHVVELPCHLVELQHSLPLPFDLAESCCCHEVPRARLLSSSLVFPPFVAVSHLILGPAQEQRLVKRESLLAQASPTYNLSCRISHRSCLLYPICPRSQSVSQSVSHSVNTALAHRRSFLPCAGHAIDNPPVRASQRQRQQPRTSLTPPTTVAIARAHSQRHAHCHHLAANNQDGSHRPIHTANMVEDKYVAPSDGMLHAVTARGT